MQKKTVKQIYIVVKLDLKVLVFQDAKEKIRSVRNLVNLQDRPANYVKIVNCENFPKSNSYNRIVQQIPYNRFCLYITNI